MRFLGLALPLAIGAVALACGEPKTRPSLEIDPIDPSPGQHAAAGKVHAPDEPEIDVDASIPDLSSTVEDRENDCQSAVNLGQLAGEPKGIGEPAETVTAKGRCSKWFKVRVNETKGTFTALAIQATLTSPPSTKFDLHAYVNKDKDESACGTSALSSSTTASNADEIDLTWGDEGWWPSDDSRTVIVEVRSADGACDSSASWSLSVHTTTST